jgi:hypothetical protein
VGEQDEVAQLAAAVADVVAQQALGLEAERGEHRDRALLVGHDLDEELAQAAVERLQERPARQRAPEPAAALARVDDQAQLGDVVGPARQPDDRRVADHAAVIAAADPAAAVLALQP